MTMIVGVIGAAILFGLFSMLRPRDKAGCTGGGNCAGCTREGACTKDGVTQ
ncbi:MAG TPA: hypothetical protein VGP95_09630 [Gemmatimonadaceae bacterium]|jgi:hypothetical protein|nr:hypothetical protein [Gemmatimonadaceae bacterium]